MNLIPFFQCRQTSLGKEWYLQGHLRVSSQDLLMGQQVRLPLLTPFYCHGTKSRQDDWSSKGFEYPSGLEDLNSLQRKAVYMTETTVASILVLAFLARSIHDK